MKDIFENESVMTTETTGNNELTAMLEGLRGEMRRIKKKVKKGEKRNEKLHKKNKKLKKKLKKLETPGNYPALPSQQRTQESVWSDVFRQSAPKIFGAIVDAFAARQSQKRREETRRRRYIPAKYKEIE